MKAAQINGYGDASVVHVRDIENPVASEGQVVVEVHASSLNPFDSKLRDGAMKDAIKLQFPITLGGDIAGVIAELGEDVTGFEAGEKVYGQANAVAGNSGAFAEFAATDAGQIAKMPSNLDFAESASLPLVGISALQALTDHLDLRHGQKILIHGGAGGIGTVAIQIAKNIGAYVATTTSPDTIDLVKKLGADKAIDYTSQDFSTLLKNYDAVFDTVGGKTFDKSLSILKPGGKIVTMVAQFDEEEVKSRGVTAIRQGTKVTTKRLDKLTKLIEKGVVTPHVAKSYPLDDIQDAFEAREHQSYPGKIVIAVT